MVITLLVITTAVKGIILLHRPLREIAMMPPLGASDHQIMILLAARQLTIPLTTMTIVLMVVRVVVAAVEVEVIGDSSRNLPACCAGPVALVVGAARGDGGLAVPALVHLDLTIGKRPSRSSYCLFRLSPHLRRG